MTGPNEKEPGRALLDVDSIDDSLLADVVGGLTMGPGCIGAGVGASDDPWAIPLPAHREHPSAASVPVVQTAPQPGGFGIVGGLTLGKFSPERGALQVLLVNGKAKSSG